MIYFDFLTENAYVQTGTYNVSEYYLEGQHALQRVENIVGDGQVASGVGGSAASATPASAFTYTVGRSGNYAISFTMGTDGTTDEGTAKVIVNGSTVDTHVLAPGAADTSYSTVLNGLTAGSTVSVTVETDAAGSDTVTVSDVSLVRGEQPLPETFQREWATFATGRDDLMGYDPGAYGIGTVISNREIVIPAVKKVTLMYMYNVASTREQRALVQYDGTAANAVSADILGTGNTRVAYTEEEFVDKFAGSGFNRFGRTLPTGLMYSQAQELSAFKGTFTDTSGNTQTNVVLYVEPAHVWNARPMFDLVYMQAGFRGKLDGDVVGVSGHLLRWRGEFVSENIAPINRSGDAIATDGYGHYVDGSGTLISVTPTPAATSENGVAYTNADAYNVRDWKRY